MNKPILCVDFDGVIHSYEKGWSSGEIYGSVVPGFFDWADEARAHFRLTIYSSRSKTPGGIQAMRDWLIHQFAIARPTDPPEALASWFDFADEKPPAFLTIDDRCVRFNGSWHSYWLRPATLLAYRPWNQPQVKNPWPVVAGQVRLHRHGTKIMTVVNVFEDMSQASVTIVNFTGGATEVNTSIRHITENYPSIVCDMKAAHHD